MALNLSDEVRVLRNYDESLYIKLNKTLWQKVTTVQHTSRRCPAVKTQHQLLLWSMRPNHIRTCRLLAPLPTSCFKWNLIIPVECKYCT